jgi:hypothetical protein
MFGAGRKRSVSVAIGRPALNEDEKQEVPKFERTLLYVNEERSTTLP